MRPLSLVSLLLVWVGCTVFVPRPPPGVAVTVRATVRAEVQVAPPPAPAPVVELVGAPVVEFFGIPLEGAQDVVFVLDCSGSMDELAQGRLAQLVPAPSSSSSSSPPPLDQPPPLDLPPPPPPLDLPPPPLDPAQTPAAPPPPAPSGPRKLAVAQAELVDALRRLPAGTRMNVVFFNNDLEAFAPGFLTLDDPGRDAMIAFVMERLATGRTALAPAMRVAFLMNARRIVLLSDGLGNVGGDDRSLLRDAREAMRGGVRIDTIGLGTDQDVTLLGTLARESGGLYQGL